MLEAAHCYACRHLRTLSWSAPSILFLVLQAGAIDLDVRELLTAYLTPVLEAYKTALQKCRSSHSGALQDGFVEGMCVFVKDQIDILESNLQLMCCA